MFKKFKLWFAIVLIFFLCSQNIFAKEKITLIIDGEKFEREYPKTESEYKELVDGLATMYNSLSESYSKYRSEDKSSSGKLKDKLAELEIENNLLKLKLDNVEKSFSDYKKDVDKLLKMNTKMGMLFFVGPSVSKNSGVGTFADIAFDYRILRNLHFGLTAGLSVYNNIDELEGRFGLLVGYSFN